jgi:hypothetical protein
MVRFAMALTTVLALACGGAVTEETTTVEPEAADAPEEEPVRLLTQEEAARAATQAMRTHVRARELVEACEEDADAEGCREGENLFRVAADTWRSLIEGRPGDDSHPEWSFMLAQASLHAGAFDSSAEAAERYLASGEDQWRVQAARVLVQARERSLAAEMISVREEPPEPQGQPPAVRAIDMPPKVRSLFDARARFVEIVPPEADEENDARSHRLANALLLHHYGDWELARPALRQVFEEGCAGDSAWDGAKEAWVALRDEALSLGRFDAIQSLGEELGRRRCDFGEEGPVACGADSRHPQCLASVDRVSGRLHHGRQLMLRAEHARGQERRRWAARAGGAYLEALEGDSELSRIARVTALEEAGRAYRLAEDAERAAQVDARIVDEVTTIGLSVADASFARVTIASALARQLTAAVAEDEHASAVRIAEHLLEDRFDMVELSEEREAARRALPQALAALGRHTEASRALMALAEASTDPAERLRAELDAALILSEGGPCRRSMRPLSAFVRAHEEEAEAHREVIEALWKVAECEQGRRRTAALQQIIDVANAAGNVHGEVRSQVAAATFELVDVDLEAFERTRIRLPRVDTVEDFVGALRDALEEPNGRAEELVDAYGEVEAAGDAQWTAAAKYEAGRVMLALEEIARGASWQIPSDLQRQRRELNERAFEQLRGITETRVQQIIDAEAAPIHCRAGALFRDAVAIAHRQNARSERITAAQEALREGSWPRCSF